MLRPLLAAFAVVVLVACEPPPPNAVIDGEGEGEGEGEANEGEGEGNEGEGEGEGEGEATVPGVNLTLDVTDLTTSVRFANFDADSCEVTNGCVNDAGVRALLSFDLVARNNGDTAFIAADEAGLVAPASCGGEMVGGFIGWRVIDRDGVVAAAGALDVEPLSVTAGGTKNIVLGPCAKVDLTDVPAGDYDFELTIDVEGLVDPVENRGDNVVTTDLVLVDMQCDDVACGGVCCPSASCVDDACQLADLTVDAEVLFDSTRIIERFFGGESCSVVESCVGGLGNRRLLNFSTTTPNDGNTDLAMGRPENNPALYSFGECHDHFHFDQYAQYRLLTPDGEVAATGHKQAFCLMDLEPRSEDAPAPQFDCSDQGISAGWADTYGRHLDCQWVDITGVPEGDYILEVAVNFARIIPEMSYTNNVARVPVFIPGEAGACIPDDAETCGNGLDDTCEGNVDEGCAPLTDNDTCAEGVYIDGSALFTGTITADNVSNTVPSCGGQGGELYFNFDSGPNGIIYASTYGSEIDTTLSIFRGNQCAPEDEEACVDDACVGDGGNGGAHFVGELEGGPYVAVVKAKNAGDVGNVVLKIQNAGCFGVDPLTGTETFGDTSDDVDNTAPQCGEGGGPDEMHYFTTCPGTHSFQVETCGFDDNPNVDAFDTVVELREGACLGPPVAGACDDDLVSGEVQCSRFTSDLEGQGAGDGLWFVLVDGFDGNDDGRYGLRMTPQ
jgi:hypothetical protein